MADNKRQYGFRFVRSINGIPNPKPIRLAIASAYQPQVSGTNVNLNAGDPVLLTTTGTVIKGVGSETGRTQTYGIIGGFGPMFQSGNMTPSNNYPAPITYGTVRDRESAVFVYPVYGSIWEVDCNAVLTAATTYFDYRALIGENADYVLTADTTNSNNPKMTPQLDVNSHAGTAALQCRIEGVSEQIDQDFTGNYVKLYVSFNNVQQAPFQTTGI